MMKTKLKLFLWALTLSIFLVACDKSNSDLTTTIIDDAITEEPIDDTVEMGTVSLNAFVKDVIKVTTGKAPTLDEVLDEMRVEIKEGISLGSGLVVLNSNYRDLPVTIPLLPGSYSLLISNYSGSPSRFDNPVYGTLIESFGIIAGSNTPLDLELALFDAAITIDYSNELVLAYPDISTKVEYNQEGFGIGPFLNWTTTDNRRTGYLDTYEGDFAFGPFFPTTGALKVEISATDSFGSPAIVDKFYTNVNANQHYNINIELTEAATASLTVTLGDEEVINDTITFPN